MSPRSGSLGGGRRFVALIGDIVGSRKIDQRAELQTELRVLLEDLNRRFAGSLAAPLVLLRGDEIQGLFTHPESAVRITVELAEKLFPVQFVYGLGCGPITTERVDETAQVDGPCFHRARKALEDARKKSSWIRAEGFGRPTDELLSSLFQLMGTIRGRWTRRQNELFHAARTSMQKQVAARFGVSPSVVSESLKASAFGPLVEAEKALEHTLSEFGHIDETDPDSVIETKSEPME